MKLNEWLPEKLSQDIWHKKYQYENETLNEWFDRISNNNEELKKAIKDKKFIFGGRILANRGLHKLGKKISYSNCYVLASPKDNLESIFNTASEMARTFSYGGGVGIDISKLAPRGAKINNAARETSGSVSFMDLYSLTTELIGQHGRRGATMISLDCKHPDLLDFINIKNDPEKITKANISVKVSDQFMEAIINDKSWILEYTRDATGEKIIEGMRAKKILQLIAESNWNMAEPGMIYWDRIQNHNIFSKDPGIKYEGVNPCAEEPLPAYGSCLLGSLNLSRFVKYPFTKNAYFNFDDFTKHIRIGVRALNEVLHEGLPLHPLKQQQESVNDLRQIGLGCFGFHDMLIKLGVVYGSNKSLKLSKNLGRVLANRALQESALLTEKWGQYPKYNKEYVLKSPYIIDIMDDETIDLIKEKGLANSQILTIPPTGSIATMLGASPALEPIFSISYNRKTESLHEGDEKYYKVFTPIVREYMDKFEIKDEKNLPDYFNTTHQIPYLDRIRIQGMWQEYIDASISSTINLPEETTVEDIMNLYIEAWKHGLKGVTIFRNNCSRTGILTLGEMELKRGEVVKAPLECFGKTYKMVTGCGNAYLTVSFDNKGKIIQTFTNKGSSGTCRSNQEAVSRLISLALRGGISIKKIIDQLKKVDVCPSYAIAKAKGTKVNQGSSCPYAMAVILEKAIDEIKPFNNDNQDQKDLLKIKSKDEKIKNPGMEKCPECGELLPVSGGCITCRNCSYSSCD